MSLDDFIKGLGILESGMQNFAVGQATRDANQQILEINKNISDENERIRATQALGQELALRLTGIGASPGQIDQVMQRLGPSPAQLEQQRFAQTQQQASQKFNAGESAKERQLRWDIANLQNQQSQFAAWSSQQDKLQELKVPGAEFTGERLPIQKDAQEVIKGADAAKKALTNLNQLIETFEKEGFQSMGAESGKLASLRNSVMNNYRVAAELGVLNAGELPFIEQAVPSLGHFENLGTKKETAMAKLKQLRRTWASSVNPLAELRGYRFKKSEGLGKLADDILRADHPEFNNLSELKAKFQDNPEKLRQIQVAEDYLSADPEANKEQVQQFIKMHQR